ncbi:RNA-directed DNA polymerase, eukaryota, Reverse transcriptase zinc-binding domain protein [Artemisia annua]|uniref:RNA-directed DNA polymerase, eukaryota, Reverse transcriptase zinc-binding domain protein n=1 Tax=Artemisia annua TaxID=35608 RepID=A0A2U1Q8B5_ARTAN|nr:RNA-directed DNA polymerase, eukaryota, Reverse transcriptase zinc-binding domain protein [Artemisia annua]
MTVVEIPNLTLEDTMASQGKLPKTVSLENEPDCIISDHWVLDNETWCGRWSWRIPPRGRALDDLASLVSLIDNMVLSPANDDKWVWDRDASDAFKVKELFLSQHSLGSHHVWNSWIPRKINICVWYVSIDRLPTRFNLASRGINSVSNQCPFCELETKTTCHSLIAYHAVIPFWMMVWSWWQLAPPISFPSFLSSILMGSLVNLGSPNLNKILNGVFQRGLWLVWKWRNKVVQATPDFHTTMLNEDIFPYIQRLEFVARFPC